jgi:hypothetical protein
MALYDEKEYGYAEEKGGKNFLEFLIDYLKQSKEAKKPKLEQVS